MKRHAGDVGRAIRTVEELYKIVFVSGSGVATARVDLTKNNIAARGYLALCGPLTAQAGQSDKEQTKKDQTFAVTKGAKR